MFSRFFKTYLVGEIRPMLNLATPIIMAELGWTTMSIVDTMMVGRQSDSAVAIGAVSLGSIIYYVAAIFGTGLMLGLDTLVSHSYGAGDFEEVHRSLINGMYLALGVTPVLMAVIWAAEPCLPECTCSRRLSPKRYLICGPSTGARHRCCSILCFADICRASISRNQLCSHSFRPTL